MSESYAARGCDVVVVPGGALFCECATYEQAVKVVFTLNQFVALLANRTSTTTKAP